MTTLNQRVTNKAFKCWPLNITSLKRRWQTTGREDHSVAVGVGGERWMSEWVETQREREREEWDAEKKRTNINKPHSILREGRRDDNDVRREKTSAYPSVYHSHIHTLVAYINSHSRSYNPEQTHPNTLVSFGIAAAALPLLQKIIPGMMLVTITITCLLGLALCNPVGIFSHFYLCLFCVSFVHHSSVIVRQWLRYTFCVHVC